MPKLNTYVEVGICSGYMDADYRINGQVADLSREAMTELRLAMIYAIVAMEEMWRNAHRPEAGQQAEKRHEPS
jgi:hypothetical protein